MEISANLTVKEVNQLEGILDNFFGRKNKKGGAIGKVFEEVQGIWVDVRDFDYTKRGVGRIHFRTDLQGRSYVTNLDVELNQVAYQDFLARCKSIPKIYSSISDSRREEAA